MYQLLAGKSAPVNFLLTSHSHMPSGAEHTAGHTVYRQSYTQRDTGSRMCICELRQVLRDYWTSHRTRHDLSFTLSSFARGTHAWAAFWVRLHVKMPFEGQQSKKSSGLFLCAASIRSSHANPVRNLSATELISPPLLTASHSPASALQLIPLQKINTHTETETGIHRGPGPPLGLH